ncbi:MAG TPA: DUF6573 family protein [Candidatus Babeliales bacterium]|nr:DUF6573 family protein [Candidatus Babeliales bacterium]
MKINDLYGDTIYSYTRAQAIEDGVLIDVSVMANEAGFRVPVAITNTVWDNYVCWTDMDTDKQTFQDQSGRLWDLLWMLYMSAKHSRGENVIFYHLYVVPRDGKSRRPDKTRLKAVINGGDNGEAVITIMLLTCPVS